VVCSTAGCYITATLIASEDERDRAAMRAESEIGPVVLAATQSFVAWLLMDAAHVISHFPTLGGADMLLHHAGFIFLTLIGPLGLHVFPFAAGWLLLGEISTLFLNLRWFLIQSGRGDSAALHRTNYAFAATFFITRVVIMALGLWHGVSRSAPILLASPYNAPSWAVSTICITVGGGALLNAFWMYKIVRMASRPGKPSRSSSDQEADSSPPTPIGASCNTRAELPSALPMVKTSVGMTPSSAEALAAALGQMDADAEASEQRLEAGSMKSYGVETPVGVRGRIGSDAVCDV